MTIWNWSHSGKYSTRTSKGRSKVDKEGVIGTDSNGNVVEYDSANAARAVFGSHVSACLADGTGTKTAGGYSWRYKFPQPHKVPIGELDLNMFKDVQKHPNYMISYDARVYNKSRQAFLTPRCNRTVTLCRAQMECVFTVCHTGLLDSFQHLIRQNQINNHGDK